MLVRGLGVGSLALTFGLHCNHEHPHVSYAEILCGGAARGTLSELMMAILSYVSQMRRLGLITWTYRVSLSDMVAAMVNVERTRLQRISKNGVGGVNFGLGVCQLETRNRAEDKSRAATRTNKHQGLNADNDTATGARVDEAQEGPWRSSQCFLPVTLRNE